MKIVGSKTTLSVETPYGQKSSQFFSELKRATDGKCVPYSTDCGKVEEIVRIIVSDINLNLHILHTTAAIHYYALLCIYYYTLLECHFL